VTVRAGERIMVNGDHGVNRKLLFQSLAGEWRCGKGEIDLPPMQNMLFIPHTAYVAGSTLRDALSFPEESNVYSDEDLNQALEKVGLGRLKGKLDTRARWDRMLDTDEQKAIGFAHALLAKPSWLILDETLEGLEPDIQARYAEVLADLKDTTMVYIGRSEAYLEALKPRVVHLQALVPPTTTGASAARKPHAAPAQAHRRRPFPEAVAGGSVAKMPRR
jgi:vitamin B12/bleomycin/antimicrobial peptide transport system ATP-binding/permease protein